MKFLPLMHAPSTSLADEIEILKHENDEIKSKVKALTDVRVYFRISDIAGNDK